MIGKYTKFLSLANLAFMLVARVTVWSGIFQFLAYTYQRPIPCNTGRHRIFMQLWDTIRIIVKSCYFSLIFDLKIMCLVSKNKWKLHPYKLHMHQNEVLVFARISTENIAALKAFFKYIFFLSTKSTFIHWHSYDAALMAVSKIGSVQTKPLQLKI